MFQQKTQKKTKKYIIIEFIISLAQKTKKMTCFVHVNQKKTLKHQSPSKVGKPDNSQGSLMGVFG